METLKKILKTIGTVISTIIVGLSAFFLFNNHKNDKEALEKAEKIKEDKKNELENKSADDIAADSPNNDTISTNIKREQDNLRKRLRDRLK